LKAHFVPVTLGIINRELAEVIAPDLSGPVVTLGHHLLEDGSAIILPDARSDTPSPTPKPSDRRKKPEPKETT
jgi:hypothetical protein